MKSKFCWFNTVPPDEGYPWPVTEKKAMMCKLRSNHKGAHRMELIPHDIETIMEVLHG